MGVLYRRCTRTRVTASGRCVEGNFTEVVGRCGQELPGG